MAYAIVNPKDLSVIEIARRRGDLHQKAGMVEVNTRSLNGYKLHQLTTLYNGLTGENRKGFHSLAAARGAVAKAIDARAKPSRTAKREQPHTGPVARVWEIAERSQGKSRKDVIEACVAEGINVHTARTQYQRWFASHKPH